MTKLISFNFPTRYAEFEQEYRRQRQEQRKRRKEQRVAFTEKKRSSIPGLIRLPAEIDTRGVGNCGIVASTIAARIPYQDAYNFYKYHSSRARNNPKSRGSKWEGSIYVNGPTNEMEEFFKHFGVKYELVNLPFKMDSRLFARKYAEKGVTYVVNTRSHCAIIRSGYFVDQLGAVPLDRAHRFTNSELHSVYRITTT